MWSMNKGFVELSTPEALLGLRSLVHGASSGCDRTGHGYLRRSCNSRERSRVGFCILKADRTRAFKHQTALWQILQMCPGQQDVRHVQCSLTPESNGPCCTAESLQAALQSHCILYMCTGKYSNFIPMAWASNVDDRPSSLNRLYMLP